MSTRARFTFLPTLMLHFEYQHPTSVIHRENPIFYGRRPLLDKHGRPVRGGRRCVADSKARDERNQVSRFSSEKSLLTFRLLERTMQTGTHEQTINSALGEILHNLGRAWTLRSEHVGRIFEEGGRPDILIEKADGWPIVIEAEVGDHRQAESRGSIEIRQPADLDG